MNSDEDIWSDTRRTRVWQDVDAERFRSEIAVLNRPAVLKGLVAHWPAVAMARTSPLALCDYLKGYSNDNPVQAFFGAPQIDGRFFYSDDLKGLNHERKRLPLPALLDLLIAHLDDERPPAFYAGAVRVDDCMPGIVSENRIGLLDETMERLTNVWIGNRTRTAAHWDLPQNLACVVSGRRRYITFPTEQVRNLYVGPLDFTLAGQSISLVDFHRPDFERYPRFREAIAHAEIAVLEPGDALYLPSLWWHHAESLDSLGMMINYWWRDAQIHMVTPLITLMHSLLTLRDLPEHERDAWRALFDFYIFQTDGDPMAHLPSDVRGIFGTMTPENASRLRAYLAKTLTG